MTPQEAEAVFVGALTTGDHVALDEILADDFILIDVMSGSEIPKAALVALVGDGSLRFRQLELHETRARIEDDIAIINGWSNMAGGFKTDTFATESRYSHVFRRTDAGWQMILAQGTQIRG